MNEHNMTKTKQITLQDSGVIYNPEPHTYSYNGKPLQGITGTLVNRAYPKEKTYADIDGSVLRHAADRGSACHQAVGNYYEIGLSSTGFEPVVEEAKRLLESQNLTPIRFEYVVTDFEHYASPIDIVCVNEKSEICIVDMKFTARLHYEQVELQTSIYQRFFHIVNPKLQAKHLYVLWIHTNDFHEALNSGIYELTPVDDAFLDDLIKADTENTVFDITKYYGTVPAEVSKVEEYLAALAADVKRKTDELNQIKDGLCQLMLDNNVKQYDSLHIKLTTVTPKPRLTFDTRAFQKDHPDLYAEYAHQSEVKPSVRLTVKEEAPRV